MERLQLLEDVRVKTVERGKELEKRWGVMVADLRKRHQMTATDRVDLDSGVIRPGPVK